MLDGRDVLGTGLGLGAFMLLLLPAPGSNVLDALLEPEAKLLGLFLAAGAAAGFCLGWGGWATTVTAPGRKNMPWPMSHSK